MQNDVALVQGFNKQEPIPGYIIKELIGTGGYGEVWKAHAPGGLVKAIKFVYGNLHSKRASRELRSLNRIKEVRHPFLLSIERIEVVDGTLVIVTELADQNLKQAFEKQRSGGHRGLPRDELLAHMRDAADALDYIYNEYSLQHLDIKPENLLLVGHRTKVADFGLIKNLYERSASLIEGLTPCYSPPELFEGKPNRHSDQYSLAIVFQEMLTGELPFDGMTAAHLAAQHLRSAPVLSSLPKCDQTIIARALSKDPENRFPNCRALVDALAESTKEAVETDESAGSNFIVKTNTAGAPSKTEVLGDGWVDSAPSCLATNDECVQLPSIDLNDQKATQYGPVLFVGIGGTATRAIRSLRRRFYDRMGPLEAIPAIDLLVLDTNVKSLNQAMEGEPGAALHANETLAMPLRRAEDYRASKSKILGSISRRWLYNIPFSLQTEGFRPLGRIAMVDHSKRLMDRLRQALAKVNNPENIATTARNTGLNFCDRQPPQIYIVASISGGTGGGMVLDVAYAMRSLLAELNLSDEYVHGILTHSTPRAARDRDKALANAYCTLNELRHYCLPGHHYPGDSACKVPAFHGNNRTFPNCYLVHLGDELTELQLDGAVDSVAEYLYASSVTQAATFFKKCRQAKEPSAAGESSEPALRSFGLCQLGGSNSTIPTVVTELLCRDLVCNWRSGAAKEPERTATRLTETMAVIAAHDESKLARFSHIDKQAREKTIELDLDFVKLQAFGRDVLEQELSTDVQTYFTKLIGDAFDVRPVDAQSLDISRVFTIIDAVLGDARSDEEIHGSSGFDSLGTVLKSRLKSRSSKVINSVREWIFSLVDISTARVEGAKYAAEWFQNYLRSIEQPANQEACQLRDQINAYREKVLAEQTNRKDSAAKQMDANSQRELQTRAMQYTHLRIEQLLLSCVARGLRMIEGQVTSMLDRLQEFWKDLNELSASFNVELSAQECFDRDAVPDVVLSHWRLLLDALLARREELVEALDQTMNEQLALGTGKLQRFLTQSKEFSYQLKTPLREAARHLILRTMRELNVSQLSESTAEAGNANTVELFRCIEAAAPNLVATNAAARLLLILPDEVDEQGIRASIDRQSGPQATIVRTATADLIACNEVEKLEIREVGLRLINQRRDYIEIGNRLHARSDIQWNDMSDQ